MTNHNRADNTMNNHNLKQTRHWRQARENACEQGTIGFNFTSDWLIKVARVFFQPITERIEAINESKGKSLSTLDWKPLYYNATRGGTSSEQ